MPWQPVAVVVLLGIPAAAAARPTAGPQAHFALQDGFFVQVRVSQAGKPVVGARVRAFDQAETVVGEGETGEEGQGAFGKPPGDVCWVGITIDGKECDLIPLRLHGGRAEPSRVLLTFGTRPCCRAVRARPRPPAARPVEDSERLESPPPPRPAALWPALAGGLCLAAGGSLLVWSRRGHPSPVPPDAAPQP
jgi:hypothetical protein